MSLRRAHDAAVSRLAAALHSTAPGTRVHLAKPSSNLFRFGARDRTPGLPTEGLSSVLSVDTETGTAEVGGLISYERLVAATLPYGLMPTVVPQLKTITLGGAVAGLGIESTSFRNGLPHEAVREMDVLRGDGRLVTLRAGDDDFAAFPNSYGTFGYAVRLVIDLEPVQNVVELTHLHFRDAAECFAAMAQICAQHSWQDVRVDFLDGVAFGVDDLHLTLGRHSDRRGRLSDYTGQSVYYRSIPARDRDLLSIHDYLWRWDTDWFWCSGAFGVQHPVLRRLWPSRYRRSDVYRKLVALDRRYRFSARLDGMRGRRGEAVIQDVEIPIDASAEFLAAFCDGVPIRPIWLCPLRLRGDTAWPLYPLRPGETYVNFGFWSTAWLDGDQADDHHNRLVEDLVDRHRGHKSLYSTVHYDRAGFWRRYNGEAYTKFKDRFDPAGRLGDLYDKVGGRT